VKQRKAIATVRAILLYTFFVFNSYCIAQTKTLKENQVVDLGGGQKLKVLRCKGGGVKQECEVVYYVNSRQVGNSFWLMASKISGKVKTVEKTARQITTPKKIEKKKVINVETLFDKGQLVDTMVKLPDAPQLTETLKQEDPPKKILPHKYYVESLKRPHSGTISILTAEKDTTISASVGDSIKKITHLASTLLNDSVSAKLSFNSTRGTTAPASNGLSKDTTTLVVAKKLGVFISCNSGCDINYIRTELTLVDFLLDRIAADVNVLINEQSTGSGGRSIQIIFYGQQAFKNTNDTLVIDIAPNFTEFERRTEMLKGIKMGILPFLLKTSYAKFIDVKMKAPEKEFSKSTTAKKDHWNYWVFRIGADGSLDKDQVYNSTSISGNVSIDRTTDKLKVSFRGRSNYYNYKYNYDDNGTNISYEILNKRFLAEHSLVKSLGSHWGIGYQTSYNTNTFSNNKGMIYGKGAIEYSIFPYKDVNTRFFTVSYGIDIRNNKYFDTTIYFKTQETLLGHSLEANISFNQKWGTFSSSIAYRSFLKDPSLSNLSASLYWDMRITGGLSFYLNTYGAYVRDQVYLLKGKASEQDVLTKRRALASTYSFSTSVGLNFRFGSKLNNFVNPTLSSF
jgi:hypothetical protein